MLQKIFIPAAEEPLLLLKEISGAVSGAGKRSTFTPGCASWQGEPVGSIHNALPSSWCNREKMHGLTGNHVHRDHGHCYHVVM